MQELLHILQWWSSSPAVARGCVRPRRSEVMFVEYGVASTDARDDLPVAPGVSHALRVFSCAREEAVISWRRVVAGCRCSYGDAAD